MGNKRQPKNCITRRGPVVIRPRPASQANTVVLSMRITRAFRAQLKAAALAKGKSVSWFVEEALHKELQQP